MRELPDGDGWQYEPKWDGFRGVLENAGGELALWSRNERPLLRYFPELRPLGELLPPHSALDGEIVIARDGALDFDAMQTRLHPAESRIRRLSAEIPAEFVVFDVLVWDGEPVWKLPLEERRAARRGAARASGSRRRRATSARRAGWLDRFEALGLDGVIAKRLGVAVPAGLARRRRQGEGAQDGRLRRRRRPLEGRPAARSRRCCSASTATTAGSTTSARAPSARGCARRSRERVLPLVDESSERRVLGAEPLGHRRARGERGAAGARRRGALRQGAGQPLPARHEVHPLARRQGRRPTARGASCARRATRTPPASRRSFG